jgi:EAL domain-containing protein (putative c-di-GMP-specific phosphodiesterase class I)
LFLHTHPDELGGIGLIQSLEILRRNFPDQPLTLEIHEAAVTDCQMVNRLRDALRDLSIFLAFDDFGEGQARLVELSEARPDFLKFDMGLTRNIHAASLERQKVVSMIARMVNELGITSLAEGVESQQDHEVLCQMDFKLAQGFFYGQPNPISKVRRNED